MNQLPYPILLFFNKGGCGIKYPTKVDMPLKIFLVDILTCAYVV